MTKRAVLIVETGPAEGREAEWNEWYEKVHIPEILERVPGFRSATRYERPAGSKPADGELGYCTVYEIEADDPESAFAALGEARQSGKLSRSDTTVPGSKLTLWVER
jgi:hypothetical protein